ncbi:MAG: hypothetical protein ACE5HF_08645 [Gemmatimonadota bacterium]
MKRLYAPLRELARPARWWVLGAVLLASACTADSQRLLGPSAPGAPGPVSGKLASGASPAAADPLFLRFDASAPPLTNSDTSFLAVAGQRMTFRILFDGPGGPNGSDRFLELGLHNETLLRYPPGHPLAGKLFVPGDTITITVSVDPVKLSAEFGPTGLQFNPKKPARLELGYRFADPDFDGDGIADPGLEPQIRMFRQGAPGESWTPLDSDLDILMDRVKFDDVLSFSRYALAI